MTRLWLALGLLGAEALALCWFGWQLHKIGKAQR